MSRTSNGQSQLECLGNGVSELCIVQASACFRVLTSNKQMNSPMLFPVFCLNERSFIKFLKFSELY